MANAIEILLKLVGDAAGAIRGFDQTTAAAKKTEEQTKKTQAAAKGFFETLPGMATAAGVAVGFVDRQFTQIRNSISAGKVSQAERDLALATNPQQEAAAIVARAGGQSYKSRLDLLSPYTWTPQNILADGGSLLGTVLGFGGRARKQRRDDLLEQQLVGMDPDDLARLAPYLPQARDLRTQVSQAAAYRARTAARPGQTTNVSVQLPVGYDPRQLRKGIDDYTRVNGN
jgi:hypothetical protein